MNVLITGCAMHQQELIECLRQNEDNEPMYIVGVNSDDNVLLRKGLDARYVVQKFDSPGYIEELIRICKEENVQIVLPTITRELEFMALNKERLAEEGIIVSVSPLDSLIKAGDKIWLGQHYEDIVPKQAVVKTADEIYRFADSIGFPDKEMCCKITHSCGGNGFAVINNKKASDFRLLNKFGVHRYLSIYTFVNMVEHYEGDVILQEYEEGHDYSVCLLADKGEVLFMLGFEANLMSFGSAMAAKIKDNENAYEIAKSVTRDTGLDGNACFDFIVKPNGEVKLLEVNPRLSASLPFIAKAGINLPYLRCRQLLGRSIDGYVNDVKYGLMMNKVYVSNYS